jgi:hypothetical protein
MLTLAPSGSLLTGTCNRSRDGIEPRFLDVDHRRLKSEPSSISQPALLLREQLLVSLFDPGLGSLLRGMREQLLTNPLEFRSHLGSSLSLESLEFLEYCVGSMFLEDALGDTCHRIPSKSGKRLSLELCHHFK